MSPAQAASPQEAPPQALICGTIAIDTLYTPHGEATAVLGGSAPYAALAARIISPHTCMIGVIGDDFPSAFRQQLETRGIRFDHVVRIPGKTFTWKARYEQDMNHRTSLSTDEGVQQHWNAELSPELAQTQLLIACNVTPRLQMRVLEQCRAAQFTMADFMESWIRRERSYVDNLLRRIDLALMNDGEACCYANTNDALEAGYCLLGSGPRYVIVKHGSAGSTLFHREKSGQIRLFRMPAWPLVHPADPTGAGDSYMGALGAYLLEHLNGGQPTWQDMKTGVAHATIIAAAACESFGTQSLQELTRDTVRQRLHMLREMMIW